MIAKARASKDQQTQNEIYLARLAIKQPYLRDTSLLANAPKWTFSMLNVVVVIWRQLVVVVVVAENWQF